MDARKKFDLEQPASWTISNIVQCQADLLENKTAIHFINGPTWSFRDCYSQACIAAGILKSIGVTEGDKVALMVHSAEDFCRYWLGMSFVGATMVAINTSMRGEPLKHQLDISGCTSVIADASSVSHCHATQPTAKAFTIEELQKTPRKECSAAEIYDGGSHDLSAIMFTSGTSGPSKGVLMPEAHCMLFAMGTIDNYQLTADDTFYICLPLFHANGLYMQLLACLAIGCKAVVRDKFSASSWLPDIIHHRATHTNTLGAVAAFIVAQKETEQDHKHSLRVVGAAPLPAVAEDAFRNRFNIPSVIPLYGMTEVNIPLYGKLQESAPGTCGYVYDKYFEVEIRHPETDETVAVDTIGEIMVRPKLANGFMSGYVGMPTETLNSWRNFWFHTGDAGYRNSRGQFVFVDRIKDCIRKRGENISSYEVEQAFFKIDCIAEVAAYGVPADGGEGMEEEVMITVLLKGDHSKSAIELAKTADVEAWVKTASANLPVFAIPRYVRITAELPKTQTGKIRKVVLREEGVTADTVDRQS